MHETTNISCKNLIDQWKIVSIFKWSTVRKRTQDANRMFFFWNFGFEMLWHTGAFQEFHHSQFVTEIININWHALIVLLFIHLFHLKSNQKSIKWKNMLGLYALIVRIMRKHQINIYSRAQFSCRYISSKRYGKNNMHFIVCSFFSYTDAHTHTHRPR